LSVIVTQKKQTFVWRVWVISIKIDKHSWLCGFFEGQSSFSVLISLLESKHQRYAIFKPRITIGSIDDKQAEFLHKVLEIEHTKPKSKKVGGVKTNIMMIQNIDDIDKVVEFLRKYRFASLRKQKSFDTFMVALNNLKDQHIYKEWDDEMHDHIKLKLMINTERKNRFDQNKWEERIKKHLNMSDTTSNTQEKKYS
jgi:hypothetical protein